MSIRRNLRQLGVMTARASEVLMLVGRPTYDHDDPVRVQPGPAKLDHYLFGQLAKTAGVGLVWEDGVWCVGRESNVQRLLAYCPVGLSPRHSHAVAVAEMARKAAAHDRPEYWHWDQRRVGLSKVLDVTAGRWPDLRDWDHRPAAEVKLRDHGGLRLGGILE